MNNKELPKLLPVTILVTSFNRLELLKKTIQYINERTFYPFRIIVIDNNSVDGSKDFLKTAKVYGKIFDYIFLEENIGQSKALNIGFAEIQKWEVGEDRPKRPSHKYFCTTNEDIYPPLFSYKNCWLTQMVDILERHEPDYGGICMRIQRTPRTDIDESLEITPCYKGFPSVFRLIIRSDFEQLGNRPFGFLRKWDSNSTADKMKLQIKKKFGFTTHIYADHAGFMLENKGFGKDVDTWTVAENKRDERLHKPYPDIDPETNRPIKINHPCDTAEQNLRDNKVKEPEITLILLTCHRLKRLTKLLKVINDTTETGSAKLLVVIDKDDTEAYNICVEKNIDCLLSNKHRDFVAQANLGIYACDTEYFVILGDDMDFQNKGWLETAKEEFDKVFPDGVGLMSFNEGIQKGRIFTTGMSSKGFVEAVGGHLYYPGYKHYKGDREVTEIARELGKYHYAENVVAIHNHFSKGSEKDATYKESEKFKNNDRALYAERKAAREGKQNI